MRGSIDEARDFLQKNPDIKTINIMISDLNGVLRGKMIRPNELLAIYENGRALPSSMLALTMRGEDVLSTGLVWDIGDEDGMAFPVANTLKRCAWSETPCAQVLLSLDAELAPHGIVADPRFALQNIINGMQREGYFPVMAAELEFYLLDAKRDAHGRLQAAAAPMTDARPSDHGTYAIKVLDDFTPFLHRLYDVCEAMGLPAESAISEFAPGQMEITLHHRHDAMQAIDEAVQYKRAVKAVAEQFGMIACFMAKPFAELSGSGLHLHVSIADENGNNLCADDDVAGSPLLRHAIGGLRQTMADTLLTYAPNANSYRRFRLNSYAPMAPTWGINNRTVSLRVPKGPSHSRHVEHRVSGADANLYLVAASVLAGMHHGMREKIDPGIPVTGNGYEGIKRSLPRYWHEAIDRFRQSAFTEQYFGARFVAVYTAIKEQECDEFWGSVDEQDYAWYLHNV